MATMKDIARIAGVSTSTVSHVINKSRFVSDEISSRVLKVAKELNYAPSALARSLKVNRTHTFGMLMTSSTNPFFGEVVKGVERNCYQKGYHLILCNTEDDHVRMKTSIDTLLQKRVDGLILMCPSFTDNELELLKRYPDIPTVIMDWGPIPFSCDKIQDNSLRGGYIATKYLINSGHKSIGCITGPLNHHQARVRDQGFQKAMQDAGLPVNQNWIAHGDFFCQGGYDAFKTLVRQPDLPTALFVCNDMMAMGVIKAAHELNIKIPEDISIIGYDDIHIANFMTPPLTTIHQPKYRLGQAAVETLIKRLSTPGLPDTIIELEPTLIERNTVRKLT
ncbi:substrate-binding domain-containing protein [Vibrio salinus]|uniref:substrate-binding domain-containing protein n=1 Tax=Vibrio salinus TaxID=2899784 RepID=UPI001E657996|nr:substrate-binding domain-containing protein [Vibrio salinus]MCE0495047.1 substrate-binding domain-containing protein [Vibrio salinus]